MKCESCGKKLNVAFEDSVNFCSNCGSKVTAKSKATAMNDVETALHYIAKEYGADKLLGKEIPSLFADVTFNRLSDDKKLIKLLREDGALDCLKEAMQKPVSEQEIAIKRAISRLPKFLQNSEDVDIMLRYFAAALGWRLPKSQPTARQVVSPPTTANSNSGTPKVGSIIPFGGYDWRVLDVQNDKALLLSEKVIEKRAHHSTDTNITWEKCDLRQYLNGAFHNKFNSQDKAQIAKTSNANSNNPWYGTAGSHATTDKIFLLSIEEVVKYFGDSGDLKNRKGWYLKHGKFVLIGEKGYYINDQYNNMRIAKDASGTASWWWLRSPGSYSYSAASVDGVGIVDVIGSFVDTVYGGVRPALWLNL